MRLFASWFYTPKKLKSFEYLNRVSVKSALNKRVEKSVVRIKIGYFLMRKYSLILEEYLIHIAAMLQKDPNGIHHSAITSA